MTPRGAAHLLLEAKLNGNFLVALENLRPYLSDDSVAELGSEEYSGKWDSEERSAHLLQVTMAVANVVNTPRARGVALWTRGNLAIKRERISEAIEDFKIASGHLREANHILGLAALQINQVGALCYLGRYPEALAMIDTAEAVCKDAGAEGEGHLATLYVNLSWLYQEVGRYDEALDAAQKGRAIFLKRGEALQAANILQNSTFLEMEVLDRLDEAQAGYELLLSEYEALDAQSGIARTYMNMGSLAARRGHYQTAFERWDEAAERSKSLRLEVDIATIDLYRGYVYLDLNLLPEAKSLAKNALRRFRREGMQREQIQCLLCLAIAAFRTNQLDQAERLFGRARRLAWRNQAVWKLHSVDTARAELILMRGRPATAVRIARRTLKAIGDTHHQTLRIRLLMVLARSDMLMPESDWTLAAESLNQAQSIARERGLVSLEVDTLALLSELAELHGDSRRAWEMTHQAVEALDGVSDLITMDELFIGLLSGRNKLLDDYVRHVHRLVVAEELPFEMLLKALERGGGEPLLNTEQLSTADQTLLNAEVDALRARWRYLQSAVERTESQVLFERHVEELAQVEGTLLDRMRRRSIDTPSVPSVRKRRSAQVSAGHRSTPQPADSATLLLYIVEDRLHAILFSAEEERLHQSVAVVADVDDVLDAWRLFVQRASKRPSASGKLRSSRRYLRRLYRLIWEPLAAELADFKQLWITLPAEWHDLPVSAFFDGQSYVVEQHQIGYMPVAGRLRQNRPVWDPKGQPTQQALIMGTYRGATQSHMRSGGAIPFAIQEAEQINRQMSKTWHTSLAIAQDATLQRFTQDVAHAQLIHIAAHANFRDDNPYFSWIELFDQRLTVADLNRMRLNGNPLVVLSGCETGLGQVRAGGALGLARGFMSAGAAALVVTLWRVEDKATAELMEVFYQTLEQAMIEVIAEPVAVALRAAQMQAIASGYPPFYWAGFEYITG